MRKVLDADVMMPKAERNIQPAVVDLLGGGAYLVEFFPFIAGTRYRCKADYQIINFPKNDRST